MQYRKIFATIDCASGTLLNTDGAKINRDDQLPRLILSDEVILITKFVNVKEENDKIILEPHNFDTSLNYRIIGDCDHDGETSVMFKEQYSQSDSDLLNGILAFHIKSNTTRFAEALKNVKNKKCEFVILASSADPISTVVLAKDSFIAENRPIETNDFVAELPDEIMTKDELQLLLDLKSSINHTHDINDIEGFDYSANTTNYSAGDGINISENIISADFEAVAAKEHSHTAYAAVTHSHVIADITDFTAGQQSTYTAGNGITIADDNTISVNFSVAAKAEDLTKLSATVGDINTILDEINGEEV